MVRYGSTSRIKRRKTGKDSNNKTAVDLYGDDTIWVEKDLEVVRKVMENVFVNFTLVPSSIALEVEMLCASCIKRGGRS